MKLPPIDEITSVTQINEWIDRWIMEILDIPISLSTNKNIDEEKVELFSATRFLKGKTNGEIKAEIVNNERLYNEDVYKRLYDENGYDRDPYARDLNAKIKDVTEHFCKIKNLHDKINGVGRYHFYAPKYTELREWKSERISLYNELQELIETPMSFDVDDNTSMPETHHQADFSHMKKKSANFDDVIQHPDKARLKKRFHELIDGKSGADVGCVFLQARIKGYITRNPKQSEFKSEFDLIGSWSAIKNYMDDNNQNALERANRIVIFE